MKDTKKLLLVLWPFLLAVVCILIITNPMDFVKGSTLKFTIPLYLVSIPIIVGKVAIINAFLFVGILVSLLYPFFRDYSFLFPTKVTFEVFYDEKELINKVKKLNSILNKPLPIALNWSEKRTKIYQELDSKLRNTGEIDEFFSHKDHGKYLSSKGKAEHGLVFHKQWQEYEITKVSGFLQHVLRVPNEKRRNIDTRYNLLKSNRNFVSIRIADFFKGRCIVKPRMAQSFMRNNDDLYDNEFIGITLARFFPVSSLEFTVFCFEEEEEKYIPMAYSLFRKGT